MIITGFGHDEDVNDDYTLSGTIDHYSGEVQFKQSFEGLEDQDRVFWGRTDEEFIKMYGMFRLAEAPETEVQGRFEMTRSDLC